MKGEMHISSIAVLVQNVLTKNKQEMQEMLDESEIMEQDIAAAKNERLAQTQQTVIKRSVDFGNTFDSHTQQKQQLEKPDENTAQKLLGENTALEQTELEIDTL